MKGISTRAGLDWFPGTAARAGRGHMHMPPTVRPVCVVVPLGPDLSTDKNPSAVTVR